MKNITQFLLVFLFPFLSLAQEQPKDPFQKGAYPPFHRMYTWEEFFNNRDWPAASAVAIALLIVLMIPIMIFQNNQAKQQDMG
jgi:hypothetical protein